MSAVQEPEFAALSRMRAVEIEKPGGPSMLRLCTRPVPQPNYGDVVIKLAYAGVNRPDASVSYTHLTLPTILLV